MKITVNDIVNVTGGRLLKGNGKTEINLFSTNSKEVPSLISKGNVLFVPVMGERVDGHLFIASACEAGAKAFFIGEGHSLPEVSADKCAIEVDNTVKALQATAAWYRSGFNIPVIGVTGSVGKTTTKEMLAAALESSLKIHKTKGNMNSQIGLPLTLFGINEDDKAAVVEMGMSEFGEMEKIAAVAKPDFAVFTNVGSAHIGNLLTRDNIRKEKLRITDWFTDKSVLFINSDDTLLKELMDENFSSRPEKVKKIVTFGTSDDADFYATSISVSGEGTDFVANYPVKGGNGLKAAEHVHINAIGLHNVRNALAAIAIAYELGISPSVSKSGLEKYEQLSMRGNIIKAYGMTIIDDTYNASPDSMKSAIEAMGAMRGGIEPIRRRIAVFADILELGDESEKEHKKVGEFIRDYNKKDSAHRVNFLVTVGKDSKNIAYGATSDISETNPVTKSFDTNSEAAGYLRTILKTGDAILIKGSRGMYTEEIVNALLKAQ